MVKNNRIFIACMADGLNRIIPFDVKRGIAGEGSAEDGLQPLNQRQSDFAGARG